VFWKSPVMDLEAPLNGLPSDKPPAACTAPLRKFLPQVAWTALYNADWPFNMGLEPIPRAQGTSDSNWMYEVRTLRVHAVQRLAAAREG
jgi:hypothetical protein